MLIISHFLKRQNFPKTTIRYLFRRPHSTRKSILGFHLSIKSRHSSAINPQENLYYRAMLSPNAPAPSEVAKYL